MAFNWREWTSDRFGLKPIKETVLDRRVAKGSWYYGDGATLFFLLMVQVGTGAFLALSYSSSPDTAYESVRYITEVQVLGWFIRGLHYWSAGMMVVMLVFHVLRQILVGGYKAPREGTWLIGVFLFFAVVVMSFTGYVLRWDERSIYALRVALTMFNNVPFIGEGLVRFIQGGPEIGGLTLTRIYAVHVIFVPLMLLVLVGFHLYLVLVHGVTSPTERKRGAHSAEEQKKIYKEDANSEEKGEDFFPMTAAKSGLMAMVVFAVVLGLTFFAGPAPLYPEANLVDRSFPVEEWWFWWYSALIAYLPPWLAPAFVVLFPILLFLAMLLLPFIDRSPWRGIRKRPVAAIFVAVTVIALLWLTDLRRHSSWTGWPDPELPPIPAGMELSPEAGEGRLLFVKYGCNSCHAIAGHGRQFGPDLTRVERRLSMEELRKYILRPPDGVAMPAYEGRLTEEELDQLAAFVLVIQTAPREAR